jgi:Apolipoprotein A1/A4/E domain
MANIIKPQDMSETTTHQGIDGGLTDDMNLVSSSAGKTAPTSKQTAAEASASKPKLTPSSPANDDRRSVGQILQALQYRPSRKPYVFACLASAAWLVSFSYIVMGMERAGEAFTHAMLMQYGLIAGVPCVFFFIIAALARRMDEMRVTARSMTEIVIRLAEPETFATEQVVTLSQAIRREVSSMGDSIERALARAGELETVVRAEVANLERSYSDNERRIRSLIDELSSEREAITSNAERVHQAITSTHDSLSSQLDLASERIAVTVLDAGTRVSASLISKGDEISQDLARVGETVVDQINERGADIVTRLSETGEEVTTKLSMASESAALTLTERIDDIDTRLRATGEALVIDMSSRGSEIAERLDEAGERLADTISLRGESLSTRITEVSQHIFDTITVHGDALEDRLAGTAERVGDIIGQRTATARELFEQSNAEIAHTGEEIISVLAERTQAIREMVEASRDHFSSIADHISTTLSERTGEVHHILSVSRDELADVGDNIANLISERTVAARDAFETSRDDLAAVGDQFVAMLTERTNHVQAAIENSRQELTVFGQQMADLLAERTNALNENIMNSYSALMGAGDQVSTIIDERTRTAADQLTQARAELNAILAEHTAALGTSVLQQVQEINERFQNLSGEAVMAIGVHGDRISDTIADRLHAFEQSVVIQGGLLASEIASHSNRFTTTVNEKLGAVEAAFANHADGFNEALGRRTEEAATILESKVEEFNERASFRAREVASSLDAVINRIDAGLEQRAQAVNESLARHALEVANVLSEGVHNLTASIDPQHVDETLGAKLRELDETLSNRLAQLQNTLTEDGERLTSALDQNSQSIDVRARLLNDNLALRAGELKSLFDTQGPILVDLISTRGQEVAQSVASAGEFASHAIETRTAQFINNLDEQQQHLSSIITSSAKALHDTVTSSTSQSVAALSDANTTLRTELHDVLERLSDANRTLQVIVGSASEALDTIETRLTTRVDDFQGALENINNQVSAMDHMSTQTNAGVERLTHEVNIHNEQLGSTMDRLQQTQNEFAQVLEHRRNLIEHLLQTVDVRAHEIDNLLATFSHRVNETFHSAEQRAREVGQFLSASTQDVTNLIGQQFEDIRTETQRERDRTAAVLRATYEQANIEMNEIFDMSLSRFKSSSDELRGVALQIQHELENTRQEVRRSAIDLPHETSEQTAAMRRVIADQVKALNDLTDIVARSGRSFDASEPITGSSFSTMSGPSTPANAQRSRANARIPEPAHAGYDDMPPPPPAAPSRRTAVAPPANNQRNANNGGWLSDLLARASRDEADDVRNGNPLDGLTSDIALMVDHDIASDVWDRWRRGERNVFSRRLYTNQGQQMFDEIRRRYRSDNDFRETVDRYTTEFERLLTDLNRDDRDGSRVRSYLISDSGKVYTMLAHASGRIV